MVEEKSTQSGKRGKGFGIKCDWGSGEVVDKGEGHSADLPIMQ